MNEKEEYKDFNGLTRKDKIMDFYYKYKNYIILFGVIFIIGFIVAILTLLPTQDSKMSSGKYKDIERIMIINAQNYAKNNKVEKQEYISLNNLNIKIDDNLNCEALSGVYKDGDSYYPYLICDKYVSKPVQDVVDENEKSKEYAILLGKNPYIVNQTTYQEKGVKKDDKYQVNIKDVDIDNGLNFVTYYINSNGKNVTSLKRIVIVENEQIKYPTLELLGNKTRTILQGSTYKETGYKAHDEEDGDITSSVIVEGNVDTSKVGTYKVSYSVTNSKGKTVTDERTIIVNRSEIDLKVTHSISPKELTNKQVTIDIKVNGDGFKSVELPDGTEVTTSEASYTVSKSDTYDFVIYDINNNSEAYSVTVKNIDTTPPSVTCTADYEKGSTNIKIIAKDTNSINEYEYVVDGKSNKSTKETYSYNGKAESVEVKAKDAAGNVGSTTCEVQSHSIIVGKNCKDPDISVDVTTCFLNQIIRSNIDLEDYMIGTVYGEEGAPPGMNTEFLKAFIIFARTYTLSRGGYKSSPHHLKLKTCSSDQNWCDYEKGCYREQTQAMFNSCMQFSIDRASYNGGKPYYTADKCANRVTTFPGTKSVGQQTYYVPSSVTSSPIWPASYATSATGTHNTSMWHPPIKENHFEFIKGLIEETAGLVLMTEDNKLAPVGYHLCSSGAPACYNDTDNTMYPDIALKLAQQGATMDDLIKKYSKKYPNAKVGCITDLTGVK